MEDLSGLVKQLYGCNRMVSCKDQSSDGINSLLKRLVKWLQDNYQLVGSTTQLTEPKIIYFKVSVKIVNPN